MFDNSLICIFWIASSNSAGKDSPLEKPRSPPKSTVAKSELLFITASSNNDTYILVVDDITLPEISEIEALQSNYAEFVESISLIKLNQVLESEISNNINDKIKNLNI